MKIVMRYFVNVMMFLLPLAFLPLVVDGFGFGKNWILLMMGLAGMVLWVVELIVTKKETVKHNLAMLIGWVVVIWSGFLWTRLPSGGQMSSLMNVGGMMTILTVGLWWFLLVQKSDKEDRVGQMNFLTAAGIIVAVLSLVVFLIPVTKLPISIPSKDKPFLIIGNGWSVVGSLLGEATLMLFLTMEWFRKTMKKLKVGEAYIREAVLAAVFLLILMLSFFKIYKAGWVVLDGTSAWVIAAETFKRSPIFGAGPGNFVQAFNMFRPVSYNLTKYWTTSFGLSSSGILNIWTELGIVGLVAVLLLSWMVIIRKKDFNWLRLMVFGAITLFTPITLVGILLMVWLLAQKLGEIKKTGLVLRLGEKGFNGAPWLVGLTVVVGSIYAGYWMVRIMMGDVFMLQALMAAARNDGGNTYNMEIKAITYNPTNADYRRLYSQTNLALATTLLQNKDISDDDKQKASVLIQQAVREAKSAVSLNSQISGYWVNLAAIYRSIVGLVEGSADYSYQAYVQAVGLDPVNPTLGLDLGGLLYAANRYEEADRAFEQVVNNKQNFANGWYNWANSAKNMNKLDLAVQRLTQALALVPKDSADYEKANKELVLWQKELDVLTKKQQTTTTQIPTNKTETLKTTEPLPTVSAEQKVNVPADQLQPPEAVVTPTATPTVTPTVQPTVKP